MSTETSEDVGIPTMKVCAKCDRPVVARGLCAKHYQQARRSGWVSLTGEPDRERAAPSKGEPCSVGECGRPIYAKGLCNMHYVRLRRTGEVGPAEPLRGTPVYERAMRLVDTSAGPDACHPWTGQTLEGLPRIAEGPEKKRTLRSARRVIAQYLGILEQDADQTKWVRMREDCDRLCCNFRHMEVTTAGRPGTRTDV